MGSLALSPTTTTTLPELATADPAAFFARPMGWWLTVAAMCTLLLVPLLMADVPPIVDYPNHLARLFILGHAGEDPVLDGIWRPHWAIIPDLGIDLVIPPLMRITTAFFAGKVALALALLVPVAGALAYSRAAFKQRLYWPMITGLMAYNSIFVLGFANFLISVGGALFAAALWIRLRRHPWAVRAAAGALCTVALFFTHILGVAFFAVLAGAAELDDQVVRPNGGPPMRQTARSGGLLIASFSGPLYLWSLVPSHLSGTLTHQGAWLSKLFFFFGPFLGYAVLPGLAVAGLFYGFTGWWIVRRKGRVGPGIPIAILLLAIAWLGLPFAIDGGTFLDSRMPLMLAFALAAGIRPPPMTGRFGRALAIAAALAFSLEIVQICIVWHGHEAQIADLRTTIAPVQPGSRVLVVSAPLDRDSAYWRAAPPGLLAMGIFRTDYNVAALVAIDRRAFWPGLFADPSQQPIAVQTPFEGLAAPGWPPDLQSLALERSVDPNWPAPYLKNWPANFDYVLVLNAGQVEDIAHYLPATLLLLDATRFAALFKVQRQAPY